MEEDNAIDVFKSHLSSGVEMEDDALVHVKDRYFKAKIRLRGNIVSVQATEEAVEPLIFPLIKHQVRKVDEIPDAAAGYGNGFVVSFKNDDLEVFMKTPETRELWILKIATASHDMAQAELDEMAYKLFTLNTQPTTVANGGQLSPNDSNSLRDFFLTNPIRTQHNFSISQKPGVPPRLISYDEGLWESKLSISLPLELVKLYKQWTNDSAQQLEAFEKRCPRLDEAARLEMIRLLRENSETLEQTWEFLSTYDGPSFRRSTEKRRVAFAPVPTNLHFQTFGPHGGEQQHLITVGVAAALPLRFQGGGLPRLRASLSIHPAYSDILFSAKRQELIEVKKMIGALSHKLETEWQQNKPGTGTAAKAPAKERSLEKVCVDLQAGAKQVYARLRDVEQGLAGAERLVDALVDARAQYDSLRNQTDNIDAMCVSLQTKIAVLDSLNDEPERDSYERNTRESMAAVLDALLTLCECLLDAQQLGRLRSLSRSADAAVYVGIVLRADFVFSQAATIAATAVMSRLLVGWPMNGDKPADLLLVVWSWLSCYGDEKGMLEDATEAWHSVSSRLLIRLFRAPSSVARSVTPLVSGQRHCVIASLPLPQDAYDALPEGLRSTEYLRVATSFWTMGVNHEATIGYQFGGIGHEAAVNTTALQHLRDYASTRSTVSAAAAEAMAELDAQVRSEPSRKNMLLYEWAMAAGQALEGEMVVSCKSGKDRTAMGVTLEQGRLMRQMSGLTATQASEVVDSLRRNGARKEVCRKNIDKAAYSFSAFQMHFLPKSFRPPAGTYAHGLST